MSKLNNDASAVACWLRLVVKLREAVRHLSWRRDTANEGRGVERWQVVDAGGVLGVKNQISRDWALRNRKSEEEGADTETPNEGLITYVATYTVVATVTYGVDGTFEVRV